ncbi:putative RNA-directed DNA polymerase, eukaryota, reverse transcriptase zinc-binding domain protein [Tanacetum coccineum]
MNKFGTKLCKIDRILVSRQFTNRWPNAHITILPREVSDHCPVLVKSYAADYGPIPFKFFNTWLLDSEFQNMFIKSWVGMNSGVVEAIVSASTHPSIILKRKLQDLKTSICAWRIEKDLNKDNLIRELKNKVTYLELKAESCDLDDNEIACRLSSLKDIEDLEYLKRLDLMQKAKIKWTIEGDEKSKFFHGMINNKFVKSRINGLLINRSWTSDPSQVTSHIFNFHKQKFSNFPFNRPRFISNLFKTLTDSDALFLDGPISSIEIKDAVWSCGSSKAPGPDGFTFKFIKHHWDTVGHNFIDMVRRFEIDGFIPKGCNPSFIALIPKVPDPLHINDFRPISLIGCQYKVIAKVLSNRLSKVVHSVVREVQTAYIKGRQIIDGPLMVNEILAWASKKRERLFFLKVDFEKAFDSLDWKFLDHTMEQIGFSHKWRK